MNILACLVPQFPSVTSCFSATIARWTSMKMSKVSTPPKSSTLGQAYRIYRLKNGAARFAAARKSVS